MKSLLAVALLCLASVSLGAASPGRVERDLGQGLAYLRVHILPTDLPAEPPKLGALVLDLRYSRSDAAAAATLGAWLQIRSATQAPVFLLVNGATAPAILDLLEKVAPIPGLVTLGTASSRYVPDILLKISASERAAYEAVDEGKPIDDLLVDNPGKLRHDEAAIAQERSAPAEPADEVDAPFGDPGETAPHLPPTPPRLMDETLQRAVQLHRALLALKRT